MKLQRIISKIGPTNFILIFLFPVLCIYEFFDGRIDVGDYGVALLFALFVNDIYLGKLGNGLGKKNSSSFIVKSYNKFKILDLKNIPLRIRYQDHPMRGLEKNEKIQKNIMNIIFISLLLGTVLMGRDEFE